MPRSGRARRRSAGATPSSGADVQGTVRYVDTERGTPGPFGSDPAGRFFGVDRTSRNLTTRTTGGAALDPAVVRAHQPRPPARRVRRRRFRPDLPDAFLAATVRPIRRRDRPRSMSAIQTDVAASAAVGLHRRPRVAGRAGRQHLHRVRRSERSRSTSIAACSASSAKPGGARWTA